MPKRGKQQDEWSPYADGTRIGKPGRTASRRRPTAEERLRRQEAAAREKQQAADARKAASSGATGYSPQLQRARDQFAQESGAAAAAARTLSLDSASSGTSNYDSPRGIPASPSYLDAARSPAGARRSPPTSPAAASPGGSRGAAATAGGPPRTGSREIDIGMLTAAVRGIAPAVTEAVDRVAPDIANALQTATQRDDLTTDQIVGLRTILRNYPLVADEFARGRVRARALLDDEDMAPRLENALRKAVGEETSEGRVAQSYRTRTTAAPDAFELIAARTAEHDEVRGLRVWKAPQYAAVSFA